MKVFLDTNVLLDVLARREPFYSASAEVWSLAESGAIQACISAISFNNVYYVMRRTAGKHNADKALRILRDIFMPLAPDALILNQAIDSTMNDFEDAIQFHSAIRAEADCLITRNPGHFKKAETDLAISTPDEFIAVWHQHRINEAPRGKPRGIPGRARAGFAEFRRSQPAFALSSFGEVRPAIHPRGKPRGILAKANKP